MWRHYQYIFSDDRLVREGEEEALGYLEGIWQNRLATFMQNYGYINIRNEMRANPQGMVNLARRMFGVKLWSAANPIFFSRFL